MKILTSYYANYKNIPSEYQCISISNSNPTTICLPVWRDVVPDWSMVKTYKNGDMNFDAFLFAYVSMLNKLSHQQVLDYLNRYKGQTLVLMCWEKDSKLCHRQLLGTWLKTYYDIDVEEYDEAKHGAELYNV